MKKYLILLILLFIPFINASCLESGTIGGVSYYEFKPSNVSSGSKVIFAFHGVGDSSGDMLSFGVYKQISTINPDAVVVFPKKGYYGVWNSNTYGNFVKSYLNQTGYSGSVGYYGFSQGALDGPAIISVAGVFENAVLVDEDFVATAGGDLNRSYNQLSTIKHLKVYCGVHCDSESTLTLLSNKFKDAGKSLEYEVDRSKNHAQMNSYAAAPGIAFLLNNGSTGSSGPPTTTSPTISTTTTSGNTTFPTRITTVSTTFPHRSSTTTSAGGGSGSGSGSNGEDYKFCPLGDDVTKDLVGVLRVMKILAPLLVIIYTTYETVIAITQGKIDEEQRKLFNKFARRVGAALLLFAIPVVVDAMMQLLNVWDSDGRCVLQDPSLTTKRVETCQQQCDHIGDQTGRDACYKNCTTTKSETCHQKCDHIGDQTGRDICYSKCPSTAAPNSGGPNNSNNGNVVDAATVQNTTPAIVIN